MDATVTSQAHSFHLEEGKNTWVKYKDNERHTKKLVILAKDTKRKELASYLDKTDRQGHGQIFTIAKQLSKEKQKND